VKLVAKTLPLFAYVVIIFVCNGCFITYASAKSSDSPHLNSTMTVIQKQLTPGQQTSIEIDVEYLDGVDIYFEPSQLNWYPFTLIEHKKSQPYLLANGNNKASFEWKITYNIELIAPRSGTYNFDNMVIQSYLGNQYSSQSIMSPKIEIASSFDLGNNTAPIKPALQGLETFKETEKFDSNKLITVSLVLALAVLILVFLAFRKQQQLNAHKNKTTNKNNSIISPQLLIDNANINDNYDWQALRQCIQQHIGFDPMTEQINIQNLALSNEYISARFSTDNKQKFIELCKLCLNVKSNDARDTENA
jgi:hypothetical protein